eukprot:6199813-Pleurochrysis_carterae.AAC.5
MTSRRLRRRRGSLSSAKASRCRARRPQPWPCAPSREIRPRRTVAALSIWGGAAAACGLRRSERAERGSVGGEGQREKRDRWRAAVFDRFSSVAWLCSIASVQLRGVCSSFDQRERTRNDARRCVWGVHSLPLLCCPSV